MRHTFKKVLRKASKGVSQAERREAMGNEPASSKNNRTVKNKPIVVPKKVEELPEESTSKALSFEEIILTSSKGKRYRVAVPKSYAHHVPRVWQWDANKYRVAELIALGVPLSQIPNDPKVSITNRFTIYCWLQHPEFKEHVDGIVLETGWANKRERISGLNRLNRMIFDKLVRELDGMKLTDKAVGPLLAGVKDIAKLIAQEKEEFVEESKVTQDTHVTGAIATVDAKLDNLLQSKTEDERKALEKEFDALGDDIIRAMTGDTKDK